MPISRPLRVLLWSIPLLLVLRVVGQGVVPLMHQEAYYWMYAEHPSLSYYDHPPMVAWVIRLGTAVFGNTEWGVRAAGGTLMLLNGVLMYRFARAWWGRTVAVMATGMLELAPVYFGIGFLATMDSALLTFWLVSVLGFTRAVKDGRAWGWYLCGQGLGGALLSKYTGVFLIPSVGLCLLLHKPWRKHIASPHPYLAVLLGVALFGPVLVWNWRHDWASFRFQFLSRFDITGGAHRHPMLEFLGQQVGVATPIVLGSLAMMLWRGAARRRLAGREKVALLFALPLLASVTHKAWAYPIHINWTAPAYLTLMPAAFQLARVRVRAGVAWPAVVWRRGVALPTLGVCAAVNFGLVLFLLVVQPRTHALRLFGPWKELAAVVEHYEDAMENKTGREPLVIVDGKYELASLMAFYRNRTDAHDLPADYTVNQMALGDTALGFPYWNDMKTWDGTDCLFLDDNSDASVRLAGRFSSVRTVWSGTMANGKTYTISECYHYVQVTPPEPPLVETRLDMDTPK